MTPLKLTLLKVWNYGIHKRKHQFSFNSWQIDLKHQIYLALQRWTIWEREGLTILQNWHVPIILRTGRSGQPVLTNRKRPKKIVFRDVIELRGWPCFHNVVKTALLELLLTHDSPLATLSLNFGEVDDFDSGANKTQQFFHQTIKPIAPKPRVLWKTRELDVKMEFQITFLSNAVDCANVSGSNLRKSSRGLALLRQPPYVLSSFESRRRSRNEMCTYLLNWASTHTHTHSLTARTGTLKRW